MWYKTRTARKDGFRELPTVQRLGGLQPAGALD